MVARETQLAVGAVILLAIVVIYLRKAQLGVSTFCGCSGCGGGGSRGCRPYLSERDNFSPDNVGACAKSLTGSEHWAAGVEKESIAVLNGY
jgi:hypothetical protein